MTYAFDFSGFGFYAGMLAHGVAVTLGLTAVSTVLGASSVSRAPASASPGLAGPVRWSPAMSS
ncbi:hypothetical protein PPGU19_062310 (plasmid) [Paraburkholderia sp. PGU19]|nr:hypothetical protein PPGU19_062310 [Paraburkholderia sp. PGU19]